MPAGQPYRRGWPRHLEIDNTVIEDSEAVSHALEWYAQGADFADTLYLAICGKAVMHIFDHDFCKATRNAGIVS